MTPDKIPTTGRDNPDISSNVDSLRDGLSTLTRVVQDLSDKVSDLAERMDDVHELVSRHNDSNGYDPDYLPDDSED